MKTEVTAELQSEVVSLDVRTQVPCRDTGTPRDISFIFSYSIDHILETDKWEAPRLIFHAVEEMYRHECAERFRVNGQLVFDPHRSVVPDDVEENERYAG